MSTDKNPGLQGEGDYDAARKFDADERRFVKSGKVAERARDAERALDGPQGAELEAARKSAAEGRSFKPAAERRGHPDHVADKRDAHTEAALDKGLEDSFPASDPLSASPGAD